MEIVITGVDATIDRFDPTYCQACFFGAYKDVFFKLSDDLRNNINLDLKNNVISKWHDESHFNKYILNKPKKILNSSCLFLKEYGTVSNPKLE
jgi:hypothetical protein